MYFIDWMSQVVGAWIVACVRSLDPYDFSKPHMRGNPERCSRKDQFVGAETRLQEIKKTALLRAALSDFINFQAKN